jgi:hypothetical protein
MGATLKRREGSRRGVAGVSATFCTILLCAFCTGFRVFSDVFVGWVVSCTTLTMTFTAFAVAIIRVGKRADEGSATQVGILRNVMGSKSTKTLTLSCENRLDGRFVG